MEIQKEGGLIVFRIQKQARASDRMVLNLEIRDLESCKPSERLVSINYCIMNQQLQQQPLVNLHILSASSINSRVLNLRVAGLVLKKIVIFGLGYLASFGFYVFIPKHQCFI